MSAGPLAVANSAGSAAAKLAAPPLACDCHLHIYDPRFPNLAPDQTVPQDAGTDSYRRLRLRTGTERAVIVTPSVYRNDNRATLAAVADLGSETTRGVAVLYPEVSDATLAELDRGGIRGIRFTLFDPQRAATRFEMVEPLTRRVQALGWHVQLHWRADQIVEHAALLERLPGTLVFDHMARLPQPEGAHHPAFALVARLIEADRAWVKLSGPYLDSRAPGYADSIAVARAFVQLAPERMVWGSDWPHPTETTQKPDDAKLFDLLGDWVPDENLRRRILVDNPARLYDF